MLPSLSVTTSTTGVELDPDGYSLVIDRSQNQPIGLNATLTLDRLSDGEHTLELSGLASNCSVEGQNPRPVNVTPGATVSVAFAITCTATGGTIDVVTATSGPGTDPDGYALILDGGDRGAVGVSATSSLSGISPGAHLLGLTGLAVNCQVAGENPRSVAVTAGQTAQVSFAVTCAAPAANTGTLEITTTTTGSDQDADGYLVSVDGAPGQPVGINAAVALANVSATEHRVRLLGVATNCTVGGANPTRTTVPSGGSATVAFTVSCNPRPPGNGTLEITTATSGSDQDPDGYTVTVDGGTGQPIGSNATVTLSNISPSEYAVQLLDVAANCTVAGANPMQVTVPSGGTARVAFTISCVPLPPGTGSVRITVATTGTPLGGGGYTVAVDDRSPQSIAINGNRTVGSLAAGAHSVQLGGLATNCTVSGDNPRSVSVTAGQTATVAFAVTCAATGPTINLRIERMWITQSTQSEAGDVPLVQGRDAFIRIFVTASSSNSAQPRVRLRVQNGSSPTTRMIASPGGSTPTSVQEGTLNSSWNVLVPGSLVQPGVSVLADVDPDEVIAETNENDNSYPASGALAISVHSVPTARIRFVPILQTANNLQGAVGNPDDLLDLARRVHPLRTVESDGHAIFSVTGPLQFDDANGQWGQTLTDLEGLRVVESSDRTYFGMVRLDYGVGQNGDAFLGNTTPQSPRVAVGSDQPSTVRQVVAHELGHTWGQLHAPCGTTSAIDPSYPYSGGQIGRYGLDVGRATLKPPQFHDIMSYCADRWISDYTYKRVLGFRADQQPPAFAAAMTQEQPSILVWGHIVNGRPVLEPAFRVVARPRLPSAPGPYSIEATTSDGMMLFNLSFDAAPAADDPQGRQHFAFAVPLDQARANRLASLRLTAPGGQAAAVSQSVARLEREGTSDSIVAQREAAGVRLQWNAAAHPMIMVRDPDTGEVLSFARGGNARVWTAKGEMDLEVSDGVQSHRVRLAISRP